MGGDHQVEPAHARRPQEAVDARLGRAAVEQRGGTGAVLDQGRIALADVEEADGQDVGRRRGGEHRTGGKHEQSRDEHSDPGPECTRTAAPGGGELEGAGASAARLRGPAAAHRPGPPSRRMPATVAPGECSGSSS